MVVPSIGSTVLLPSQERREKELREERERLEGAVEEERRWRERREGEHQAARKELEAAVQELRQRAEAAEGARERMARERDERRAEAVLLQARLQEMEGQLKAEMVRRGEGREEEGKVKEDTC